MKNFALQMYSVRDHLTMDPGDTYRRVKADLTPTLRTWLQANNRFEIHGWGKRGPRGKRKLWKPTIQRFRLTVTGMTAIHTVTVAHLKAADTTTSDTNQKEMATTCTEQLHSTSALR